ncbi:hypothetical protein LOK49_Contig201G00003 [Camellia lanceoleosa]|nr:hypothetical protein LOK49_Contig201G00003 [Camellia lanceoleosa]
MQLLAKRRPLVAWLALTPSHARCHGYALTLSGCQGHAFRSQAAACAIAWAIACAIALLLSACGRFWPDFGQELLVATKEINDHGIQLFPDLSSFYLYIGSGGTISIKVFPLQCRPKPSIETELSIRSSAKFEDSMKQWNYRKDLYIHFMNRTHNLSVALFDTVQTVQKKFERGVYQAGSGRSAGIGSSTLGRFAPGGSAIGGSTLEVPIQSSVIGRPPHGEGRSAGSSVPTEWSLF